MTDDAPTFFFEGMPVGRFIGSVVPRAPGRHAYEPFRGPGHVAMQARLRAARPVNCYYDATGARISFKVNDCPEHGVLDLCELEVTERGLA